MTDHGLCYTDDMIWALLGGCKIQTRRPITAHNSTVNGHGVTARSPEWRALDWAGEIRMDRGGGPGNFFQATKTDYLHVPTTEESDRGGAVYRVRPRIETGDRVWAREAWRLVYAVSDTEVVVEYRADDQRLVRPWDLVADPKMAARVGDGKWHPSIHMPKAFARLRDKVVDVRAQRVQDISWQDAVAEGWPPDCPIAPCSHTPDKAIAWFANTWRAIYAARGLGWADNPWVWAYTLEEIEHGQD